MFKIQLIFSLIICSNISFSQHQAWQSYKGDFILHQTIGQLEKPKSMTQAESCKITLQDLPKAKKSQLLKDLEEASKAKELKAYHFTAQVPSYTLWGIAPHNEPKQKAVVLQKFIIKQDHSHLIYKEGDAAQRLMSFAADFCKTKATTTP